MRISRRVSVQLLASLILLSGWWVPAAPRPAAAQSGGKLELAGVDAGAFPEVAFFLRALNEDGSFFKGLQPADVNVAENGISLQLETLEEYQPGVQTILVMNLSDAFAKKVEDKSIYERITAAWDLWLRSLPENDLDDFSIGSNTGLQVIRERSPRTAADGLARFAPDLKTAKLNMLSLATALDLAMENTPTPYTRRAILYVTGLPASSADSSIKNLTDRAKDQGTRVFVWLIGQPKSASTPTGQLLAELAFSTGGQLFSYSGSETLPDIETYLAPLRSLYRGTYTSPARKNGEQRVRLSISVGGEVLESSLQSYSLALAAPNPIFLAPPARVERTWEQGSSSGEMELRPDSVPIHMLLEFKDGLSRSLVTSQLLVDGLVVDQNTSEPFDLFEWPVNGYESSGQHHLQIQVEDSLGFTQTSSQHQVEVLVAAPVRGASGWITRERILIAIGLLAALLALTGVIVFGGKKGWHPLKIARRYNDPVSQPIPVQPLPARRIAADPASTLPRPGLSLNAPAFLLRLDGEGLADPSAAVPLSRSEITFGSDPHLALCVLDDSTVDPLHAQLRRTLEGDYLLSDAGSTAGTWVNYQEAGGDGTILKHGDRVHIGGVLFRFENRDGGALPAPAIAPVKEDWF